MSGADRGRIPFALLGALLLISSAAIAATSHPRALPTEPAVAKAMDRATAQTQTALRDAVTEASRNAARTPVIDRANTSAGRVLNESSAFRDALRIRIYLAVEERLERIDRRRGGVRVTVSVPPVTNASSLRAAKRRVHVERFGENGTAIRMRIDDVTVTARRNGRVVTERQVSPTLVVGTPVLGLHDRVRTYQRKLDAGVAKPGLSQRLTAWLYPVAWTRAYAQYGGAPIDNVVANRHVELATNAGLLDVQRATIGRSDRSGRRTLAVATAKTAGGDLLRATGTKAPQVQRVLNEPTKPVPHEASGFDPQTGSNPDSQMTVGVNGTADRALLDLVETGKLNRSIRTVYSTDVRLVSAVDRIRGGDPSVPPRPSGDWSLRGEDRHVDVRTSESEIAPPPAPPDWHRFESYGREVTVERTRIRRWRRGNETRTTRSGATETLRVSVAVVGRHATSDRIQARSIATAHRREADPFDGSNLADVRERAIDRLVTRRGGPNGVIARAATGTLDTAPVWVNAAQPDGIFRWAYRDLMGLRERIRAVNVSVEREDVGTFETNPHATLADRLRERHATLVDAPATYDSTASKARVVARTAYVDSVIERLETQSSNGRTRTNEFADALKRTGNVSLSELRAGSGATLTTEREMVSTLHGPTGPVSLRVDSAPSYLTRGKVTPERVPELARAGHPLVVRNVNVFTVPYGDVSDSIVDGLGGAEGNVRLATAARTLRAVDATLERSSNETLRDRRANLRAAVADSNTYVRRGLRVTLAKHRIGDSRAERRTIVASGLSRWNSTAARALALSNGSASEAVAIIVANRSSMDPIRRDLLRLRLERRTRTALSVPVGQPDRAVVDRSRSATQSVAATVTKEIAREAAKRGIEHAFNRSFDRLPAGLPLAPPLTAWYATTNVWVVTVRGEYARFGVRADRGRPGTPGAGITYTRDGRTVALDVDDDGEAERLGRATRVDFDVTTAVVVVVPPGKSGVGDRDGNADERSAGWPTAGT